jgi:hypothetical protein
MIINLVNSNLPFSTLLNQTKHKLRRQKEITKQTSFYNFMLITISTFSITYFNDVKWMNLYYSFIITRNFKHSETSDSVREI